MTSPYEKIADSFIAADEELFPFMRARRKAQEKRFRETLTPGIGREFPRFEEPGPPPEPTEARRAPWQVLLDIISGGEPPELAPFHARVRELAPWARPSMEVIETAQAQPWWQAGEMTTMGMPAFFGMAAPQVGTKLLTSELKQFNKTIKQMEALLKKPGKLPAGQGTKLTLRQELGTVKAQRFQAEAIRRSKSTDEVLDIVRREIEKPTTRLLTAELHNYQTNLDDFVREVEGARAPVRPTVPEAVRPPVAAEVRAPVGERVVYHAKTKGDFVGGKVSTEIGSDADILGKGFYFGPEDYVKRYGQPQPFVISGRFATQEEWVNALSKYAAKPIREQRAAVRLELQAKGYSGVQTAQVGVVWDDAAIRAAAVPEVRPPIEPGRITQLAPGERAAWPGAGEAAAIRAEAGRIPPRVPPGPPRMPPEVPPPVVPPTAPVPTAGAFPEGTARAVALAEEKVRQVSPGLMSRAFDAFPVTRPIYRFFAPAKGLTQAQHVAWVAKSSAVSEYQTLAFSARSRALRGLDEAFGPAFKTGAKADLAYVGPTERAKSQLIGTAVDVLPNPDHYVLSQVQRQAIAQVGAYESQFLDRAVTQYGAQIGRFPVKEGAAFVPNVDVSESALEVLGNVYTAARRGRAKTRIWQDAIARQAHTPSFKPETNLVVLFEGADQAKATLIASEVFKARLGGLTKLEVLQKTHPGLARKMVALRKRLVSLRGSAGRLEAKVQEGVDDFLMSPIDDIDLTVLRDTLDVKLARGPRVGMDVAAIQKEIGQVRTQIRGLQPYWKAANLKPYVFVKEGVFRYFPVEEAKSLRQLLDVSTNPALSLAWEVRNIAFNLDLSPITGVHLPLGFLADPLGTSRQLVRGTRTAIQRRSFLEAVKPSALVDDIARDPVSWGEFAAVSGRPVGATATEFAGGILRRIPGYEKANEAMFTLVTRRTKAMWDDLVRGAEKAGIPHNEAVIAASENVHRAIPLVDHALLGQSQARAKLLQSLTISPSFLLRPGELMAESAKALVKAGLKQTLTTKEKMALRVALTMAATIETISVTSAVIDAWRHNRDPAKAAIDALDSMALHLFDGRKIPIGGPYRSMVNALKPRWINKEMDYMIPFAGMPRWAMGKMTPLLRTQYDLIRGKDFFNRRIMTGDFPVNILQAMAYEVEGAVPLSISAWMEGQRTGASLEKTAEEAVTQLLGTSLYERPGPWGMREEWRDELRDYWEIATTAIERKKKGQRQSRTQYRKSRPDVDAKLFVTGEVSSLQSRTAVAHAFKLIQDNNIDPERIWAIEERKKKRAAAQEAGVRLETTLVDELIRRLELAVPQTAAPQDRWGTVRGELDSSLLGALDKVWFQNGSLTDGEKGRLQEVHGRNSFGQDNFDVWLKQMMRQDQEKAALLSARV